MTTRSLPQPYLTSGRGQPYSDCMKTKTLTASQTRNLEIIRAAGGTIVSRSFSWFAPNSTTALRGLHHKTLNNLISAGLLRAYNTAGEQQKSSNIIPARIEIA